MQNNYSKTLCPICNRLISNNNIKKHLKSHDTHLEYQTSLKTRYTLNHEGLNCVYCGKLCKNKNSLVQHEIRCKNNPDKKNCEQRIVYCKYCNKQFTSPLIAGSHEFICIYNPKSADNIQLKMNNWRMSYNANALKGLHIVVQYKHSDALKKQIGLNTSKSLKKAYALGLIKPSDNVGRGKLSYLHIGDNVYVCRSTYEFIYALHLHYIQHKQFTMEQIRLPAIRHNEFSNTLICDFYIKEDNLIVEIKGYKTSKDTIIKDTFENAGYNFCELFEEDINTCKTDLKQIGIDIDLLLKTIKQFADNKTYYHHYIDQN